MFVCWSLCLFAGFHLWVEGGISFSTVQLFCPALPGDFLLCFCCCEARAAGRKEGRSKRNGMETSVHAGRRGERGRRQWGTREGTMNWTAAKAAMEKAAWRPSSSLFFPFLSRCETPTRWSNESRSPPVLFRLDSVRFRPSVLPSSRL